MRGILGLAMIPVASCLLGCAAWTNSPHLPPDDFGPVSVFCLTERGGRTVTNDDLRGKVWVASFVFTRCTGPCPQVTGAMARLQSELAERDGVVLVTITVDPDRDDLAELRDYAEHFGADKERWLFLTGKREEIDALCIQGFGLGVQRRAGKEVKPGQEVTHSTKLVLVDRRGNKRGYFDGRAVDETGQPVDELPRLKQVIATLLREPS